MATDKKITELTGVTTLTDSAYLTGVTAAGDNFKMTFSAFKALLPSDLVVVTVSADYTITQNNVIVIVIGTSPVTISLKATSVLNDMATIIRAATATVTVAGNGINIAGAATQTLTTIYDVVNLISRQTEWVYSTAGDSADTLAEVLAIGNTTGATDIEVTAAQKVQFRDAAIYINSSVDGQLDIVADTEIQIAATTVDLNGNLDVSGTLGVTGVATLASLVATTADINAGTIDNTVIGGTTAAAGSFTTGAFSSTLGVTGVSTLAAMTATTGAFSGEISANGGIALGDSDVATFGAGDDLQIYHDGGTGDSIIAESGAGNLFIRGANTFIQNPTGSSTYMRGIDGGAVDIRYAGVIKLATTNTGIDVTGTVTADGLTVDGAGTAVFSGGQYIQVDGDAAGATDLEPVLWARSKVGASIPQINVKGSQWQFGGGGTLDANPAMTLDYASGDISFYEDTGTTPKFFWDAAAERLGLGTTTPAGNLHIEQSGTNPYIRITETGNTGIDFGQETNGNGIINLRDSADLRVFTSATEAMRIDASGNLLVGKSATGFGTAGIELRSNGELWATTGVTNSASFNRTGSYGAVITINSANTPVGSIGTFGGYQYIIGGNAGGTHAGLRFINNASIRPCGSTGNDLNATLDLGTSAARFKDLYLSGGVYLGGTGAANLLDDYEEGTYVATLTPSTSGSITLNTSFDTLSYTKVGRIVSIVGRVRVSSVSSPVGTWVRVSLPFNIATGSEDDSRVTGAVVVQQAAQDIDKYCIHPKNGTSYIEIGRTDNFASSAANDFSGDELVAVNFTYISA